MADSSGAIYWLTDTAGTICGVLSNGLLIAAALRTGGRKMPTYSALFLAVGIFDAFFSLTELMTQHQLVVRRGVMYVLPRGVEQKLPASWYPIFALPHGFVTMHGLFIFGGLYKFRHDVLTNNSTSIRDLLKVLGLTSACGLFTGLSLVLAIHQTKERGDEFYIHQLDPNWREHPDLRYYMHAVDIRDAGGMGFFYGGLLFAVLWVTVAAWYTWKAFRFVNTTAVRTSERTAALQRQFTLSLIVQTVNACIFAVVPVTLICVAMLFRLEGDFVGTCTLLPLSWLPFVNAALTIYVVKAYRSFVVSLFSTKKRKEESGNSSGERRFVQTSTNAIEDKSNILV